MAESSAHSERTYGNFATVITMLSWFYLQSLVTLIGVQLNVVLKERLHPRGLIDAPATEADHRAYDAYAKERTYHPTSESTPSSGSMTSTRKSKVQRSLKSGNRTLRRWRSRGRASRMSWECWSYGCCSPGGTVALRRRASSPCSKQRGRFHRRRGEP